MERILCGDALEHLRTLQSESVHVCVTSPPYYHLHDYGTPGQIGRESAPEAYIERLTGVFREVRRVLRRDGTLWLNIGDSYAARSGARPPGNTRNPCAHTVKSLPAGYKCKDLVGIPGTPDDWYEADPDGDGEDEVVHVGEDGIPGTDDDWYEGDGGEKIPLGAVKINFDANGGAVNGKSVFTMARANLKALPKALREGYSFSGWFATPTGGTALTLAAIRSFPVTTTVYAQWTRTGEEPEPPAEIVLAGVVKTDHGRPLGGAVVTVRNTDTGETAQITTGAGGAFTTSQLAGGQYEIAAHYTHKYGTNDSERVLLSASKEDVELVIVLSYTADVNGDGQDETVHAGEDDEFDTPDDFYPRDLDGGGEDEKIYAGEDKTPGTKDDFYLADPNRDGKEEKVFVGEDKIPGTEDDYYFADPDGDSEDKTIHVGGDGIPGTPDDWYEADPDKDGEDEIVHVGEDGIPGTDDDWYEGGDGEKIPFGAVKVNFDANGGTVNGKAVFTAPASDVSSLPNAVRRGYTFSGWFTAPSGGEALTLEAIQTFPITTTVYAHWTLNPAQPGGGSGGGGGGGGFGGGGGSAPRCRRRAAALRSPNRLTRNPC